MIDVYKLSNVHAMFYECWRLSDTPLSQFNAMIPCFVLFLVVICDHSLIDYSAFDNFWKCNRTMCVYVQLHNIHKFTARPISFGLPTEKCIFTTYINKYFYNNPVKFQMSELTKCAHSKLCKNIYFYANP